MLLWGRVGGLFFLNLALGLCIGLIYGSGVQRLGLRVADLGLRLLEVRVQQYGAKKTQMFHNHGAQYSSM